MTKHLDIRLIVLAGIFMLVVALGRWLGLSSNAWDLGIFTQFSWLLSRGYFLDSASLTGWPVLADHASFVLIPISGFYRVWSSSALLLGFQTLALTGASLVLLRLAILAKTPLYLQRIILLAYFVQPVLWNTAWFDFHPDSLFPLTVFSFWLQVIKKRYITAFLLLILILSIRETSVFVVAGLSLTCFLQGRRKLSLVLSAAALSWAFFLVVYWYPAFFPGGHHNSGSYTYLSDLLQGIFQNPFDYNSFVTAFQASSLYLLPLFVAALLIPWLVFMGSQSISWLLGASVALLPLALSSNANQVAIHYHYGMMLIPFFALASIESVSTSLLSSLPFSRTKILLLIFVGLSIANLIINLNFKTGWLLFWRNPQPFLQFHSYLSAISAEERVLASNGLSAHLANRHRIDFLARSSTDSFPEGFSLLVLNETDPGFASSPEKNRRLVNMAVSNGWKCDSVMIGHLSIVECADK